MFKELVIIIRKIVIIVNIFKLFLFVLFISEKNLVLEFVVFGEEI